MRELRMGELGQKLKELFAKWRTVDIPYRNAHSRGLRLLHENLSASQQEQLLSFNCFETIGGDTGIVYRIYVAGQMNVEQLDAGGKRTRRLCFVPEGGLPLGDMMLAQKIALELFESEALQIANAFPLWKAPARP